MKKFYTAFVIVSIVFLGKANAQIVNIPDQNLKDALVNYDDPVIDTNGDGEIQNSEAIQISELKLYNKDIDDLTGVEAFENLQTLRANKNNITSIDFSLPTLEILSVYSNNLQSIDLSQFPNLHIFTANQNNLQTLNLNSVPQLHTLNIDHNSFNSIDLTPVPLLEDLDISSNSIQIIDVTSLSGLKRLNIGFNNIGSLDISSNEILESLRINNNSIENLDLTSNPQLDFLDVTGNDLDDLDLSQNLSLTQVVLEGNNFETLDLSSNPLIYNLFIGNSTLTTVDISNVVNLENLSIRNATSLTSINLSANQSLKKLLIDNSALSNLNTSNNSELVHVKLTETNMSTLDFSNNPGLLYLEIDNNPSLTSFNLKNGNNSNIDNESHTFYYENNSGDVTVGIPFISQVSVQGCPNLNSICVDDIDYATANFVDIEDGVTFTEDCMDNEINNELSGFVTYDENNNGCEANDIAADGFLVKGTDGSFDYGTFVSDGNYSLNIGENTYTFELANLPNYYSATPETSTITFTGSGEQEQLDFCLTATQAIADLNVTILPINQARPGFEAEYQVVVENMGTQTVSGAEVSFGFDDAVQTFVSASPSPASTTGNTATFDLADLPPFAVQTLNLTLQTATPPTVNGDDILNLTAGVTPDANDNTPEDNTFEFDQEVVNSFDPNDKQVVQGDEILIDNADQYLDYIIRFQNTGTASAINVRILDTLHPKLDYSTISPVSASHDYRVEITDNNQVEFIFDDINLPYEDEDEAGSQGFVAYKIKPKSDVEIGDVITGDASIYFDFNEPIITNMVSTTFIEDLSTESIELLKNQLVLYPNPTKNTLNLKISENLEVEEIHIYNLQGQTVKSVQNDQKAINIENLEAGLYFVTIKTDKGSLTRRVVKE